MADFDRGPSLMSKYVWLIETVYRAKRIPFKEINELWRENKDLSRGENLPVRTFNNWRAAILDIFGVCIENEHCGEYPYYIENEDDISKNGLSSWIFNTFCVGNALTGSQSIKDRILLEHVPSGQIYLRPIIEAMKENRILNITYYSYWRNEEYNFDVQPYCVKLYRQRWYMVALSEGYDEPRIYALDRIRQLSVTDVTFKMPKNWSAEEYFEGCYGVIRDHDYDKELVKLKVTAGQANYIRGLRLHESQKEVERNDEFSIFTLFIRPAFDFIQELFWQGEDVEVLEPQWLREEMAAKIERMYNRYKKD